VRNAVTQNLATTPAPTVLAAFADGEARAFFHGDQGDQLDGDD
jgi:hypothetical protein